MTGVGSTIYIRHLEGMIHHLSELLKTDSNKITLKVEQLIDRLKQTEKEVESLKMRLASTTGRDLLDDVIEIAGVQCVVATLNDQDPKTMRDTMDRLKSRLTNGVVILATVRADKVNLIAGVTDSLTDRVQAGELIGFVAAQVGGKGGGRADMAQAGGNKPQELPAALLSAQAWLKDKLVQEK